ncbi:hypothetical protein C7974DRAFT_465767 [Boeremia exigua]|uniref:uncharacterized protein n=1 Tax=Boeremia exigua TaxID=749465 RepID=UPI001E8DCECE|nr:uncharacterized protein C7974DRAFT_465767 [Boeremia exigua]KAH6616593.1 hypothetical protein C7974DRAFT_465767 [Boeremia exigua]
MPVTITTAIHASRVWDTRKADTAAELLKTASPKDAQQSQQIIQSSYSKETLQQTHTSPSRNGLVYAAYHAYSAHHHLIIRPEDVWFAILSQLNFYINAHAEELRDHFVAHKGQKKLEVYAIGNIHTVDFGALARHMTKEIQANVKDPDLQAWIMPDFSTTTESDRAVAAVLMMGAMQKYFSYRMSLMCGIPSVTLLGERSDWENILEKLNKLSEFGDEPTTFAELLRPILRNFIATFDAQPEPSADVLDFWSKIADRRSGGSGPSYMSGWITAFCMWDEDGKLLRHTRPSDYGLDLEDTRYHQVDISKIPSGFASVPVTVDDNGQVYHTKMIAGSFGIQATSSGQKTDSEEPGLDSVQPSSGWIMYAVAE